MNLGQFRELTKFLPDDIDLIFEARSNPCGNVWGFEALEATQLSFFGTPIPAIKLLVEYPDYASELDLPKHIIVHPTNGSWIKEY